jgi:DNA invertase Pin-like site-specific DNA recombinase
MNETHPEKRLIGYARVSTYGQTLDTQLEQLRKAGCSSRNICREKVTGARADRRELNRMLGKLAPGDVVTVTRIDRLARSTFDLFAIVKQIVDAKAQFRSLAEPWADSTSSTGRLMLAVLGGLADVERDLIRTRTAEGRTVPRPVGSTWAVPLPSHRSRRKRPADGARRALRSKNWRTATTSAARRFHGSTQFNILGSLHESALSVRHLGRSMNGLPLGWRPESHL